VYYGDAIDIEGKTPEEIANVIEPLDFIVWKGHLIIAIENGEVIESSNPEGVHKTQLIERLYSVMESRTPVNDYNVELDSPKFVVRRWIK
jgi:ABC-type cobalamin/Fe3+-siderophores transport system ATPase subunit